MLCPCRAVCNFPLLWCKLVILRVTQSDTLFPLPLLELGPELLLQIQTENSECICCVLDRCKFISYYYWSMKMIINCYLITMQCIVPTFHNTHNVTFKFFILLEIPFIGSGPGSNHSFSAVQALGCHNGIEPN